MASSFRTNNLIVSGTMLGNGHITEVDTSSSNGNAANANYWIKVAECTSDSGDRAQAEIHVSFEGKAGDFRCGGIVYLRHGGNSASFYDISVDLVNPPSTPNSQDNTGFVLTFNTTTRKSQLWVQSNETFQKCYATIVSGTRQPNESFVNFYELTQGSTWAASITSLGSDLTATYTNRTFNDLSISSVSSTLDLKSGLLVTGSIETTGDISLLANKSLKFNNPGENDQSILGNNNIITLDGDLGVVVKGNNYVYHNINDENANLFSSTYTHFNNANSNIDFKVKGNSSNSLINIDAGENAIAIGAVESTPFSTVGIGQDVLNYISGSRGSKNGSSRGTTLVTGDTVFSGSLYHGASGNSIIRSTEHGRIRNLTEANLNTGVFLSEDEVVGQDTNLTTTSFRSVYVCHSSGSFEKLSFRFSGGTTIESQGGLTASFHLGKDGFNVNNLDTAPSYLEEVFINAANIEQDRNLHFVFSGSNFEPGDAYSLRIKSDANGSVGSDLFGAYTFIISHFI
jgi:hypothetical protein